MDDIRRKLRRRHVKESRTTASRLKSYFYSAEYFLVMSVAFIMLLITFFHLACLLEFQWFSIHKPLAASAGSRYPNETQYHPTFMSLGLFLSSGVSILLFRACCCYKRRVVKLIHTLLHWLTVPMIIMGIAQIKDYHDVLETPYNKHYFTFHGWLGIFTILLFLLQIFLGMYVFYGMQFQDLVGTASFRAKYSGYHMFLGMAIFFFTVQQCVSGTVCQQMYLYPPVGYQEVPTPETPSDVAQYANFTHRISYMKASVVLFATTGMVVLYALIRDDFRHRGRIGLSADLDP